MTTRLPMTPCPICRLPLDAATAVGKPAVPKHGNFTVCIRCGARLRFERSAIGQLSVRACTAADNADIHPDTRRSLERVERAALELSAKRGAKA